MIQTSAGQPQAGRKQINRSGPVDRPPAVVRWFDPILRRVLGMGLPLGPNALLTVRGRKSGELRSAGVAVVEFDGRRWVMGAYGDVNWVRNLRAAGEATLRVRGKESAVRARELTHDEAVAYVREVLIPFIRRLPRVVQPLGRIFAGDLLDDPERAVAKHPVFELTPR
jgi:deazaflavin-dependent oxidoreductase (nitroreductase family)